MPNRYKKIKFNNFSGGRNQVFYDEDKKTKFSNSDDVQIDEDSNLLQLAFDTRSIDVDYSPVSPNLKCLEVLGSISSIFNQFLGWDNNNDIRLISRLGFFQFSERSVVEAGFVEAEYLVAFKNVLIAFYEARYSTSTDQGQSWTNQGAWIINDGPISHVVTSDGMLFIATDGGSIYTSDDGITFVLYYDGKAVNERIIVLTELDGFVYAVLSTQGFVRNSFVRFENNVPVKLFDFLNDNVKSSILQFNFDFIYLADVIDSKIVLYRYNKSTIEKVAVVDDHVFTGVRLHYSDGFNMYFTGQVERSSPPTGDDYRYLYSVNKFGGVFRLMDFDERRGVDAIVGFKGKLIFQVNDHEEDFFTYIHENSHELYQDSGYCELPIFDEFEHVPIAVKVKHDPLPSGCVVSVYAKYNNAVSWGSAVLTSNVADSVSKLVKLVVDSKYDMSQFKIELIANNDVVNLTNQSGFWPLDEGSGITTIDRSGRDNDGTLNNAPTWVEGKSGQAIQFDGIDQYVALGNDSFLQITGNVTFSAFIYPTSAAGNQWVVSRGNWNTGLTFGISSQRVYCEISDAAGAFTSLTGDTVMDLNTWHHIAVTWNATTGLLCVYLDGVLDNSKTFNDGGTMKVGAVNCYIGRRETAGYFVGKIDEVRMFNNDLSLAQLVAINDNPASISFSPKNVSLEYLYLPTGLENAK